MSRNTWVVFGLLGVVVLVGLYAGAAFAAPRATTDLNTPGNRMMLAYDGSAVIDGSSIGEMYQFMDRYSNSDGSIDFNRMHLDIASGKVAAPCGAGDGQRATSGDTTDQYYGGPGYGMMGSFQ